MRTSIQTKVSVIVIVFIVIASTAITFVFMNMHRRNEERGLIIRGSTLNYSLSKAAERAMIEENLDLIKMASYLITAPDVALVQVYTNLWDAVDAFPFERLKEPPDAEAVKHFKQSVQPFAKKTYRTFDFYGPIVFTPSEGERPVVIGYARNVLASDSLRKGLGQIAFTYIVVSSVVAIIAILAINTVIRRVVTRPVMRLHESVTKFKDGVIPDKSLHSADEIGELSREFGVMSRAIKDREERLLESEKRLSNLFERVEHAVFRLDGDGNIIKANTKFANLFGNTGKLCALFKKEKGADEHVGQCLQRALTDKVINEEEQVIDAAGGEHTMLFSLYPDLDKSGVLKGYDGYFLDITERKMLEEQLRMSQKMEALGTLTGGISHEFNNVLAAIIGFSEMLGDEMNKENPHKKYIEMINAAAHRGADLTKGLLAYSRRQITDMRPIDISSLIKNMEEFLSRIIGPDIRIETKATDTPIFVMADRNQIEQVFLNLAANARDAMPHGGVLRIGAELHKTGGRFAKNLELRSSPVCVLITFVDTGAGMDAETRQKIFEPFFTTKEVGKGTGLGLSVVYGIVKTHGGHIETESETGRGTRFKIYLPVAMTPQAKEDAV